MEGFLDRSGLCRQVRGALKRLPPPFASHYGVVPLPPPMSSPSIAPVMREIQAASAALARLETLTSELGDPWLVSRVLMRREAVSSSAIEGTNSTLDELLAVEETGDTRGQEAARQVRDYAHCLDAAVPRATSLGPSVFTAGLIGELHRMVMKNETGYAGIPGKPRAGVVWVGGRDIAYSTYNPTPPEDIGHCLADSIAYMRGDADETLAPHIIVRMAVAHAHFEAVHPFTDGNGRVGRLLLPLLTAAQGHAPLFLSPYIEANRSAYYGALKATQQRLLWHEMIGFVSDAVTGSVAELVATRRALQELRTIWLSRRKFRSGSAALRALDVLPHYPIATIGRLASLLDVSTAQAGQAVQQLMDAGILRERTGYRRNRLFAATEALSIINRPFGEDPILPALALP
jgi:Fic family protein